MAISNSLRRTGPVDTSRGRAFAHYLHLRWITPSEDVATIKTASVQLFLTLKAQHYITKTGISSVKQMSVIFSQHGSNCWSYLLLLSKYQPQYCSNGSELHIIVCWTQARTHTERNRYLHWRGRVFAENSYHYNTIDVVMNNLIMWKVSQTTL